MWAHAWRRGFSLTADLSGWPDQCAWLLGEHRRRPVVIAGAVQDAGGLWHLVGSSRCCTTSTTTVHRRRVVAETADAGSIPPARRCPAGRSVWPGYTGAGTRHHANRVAAIAYLGESCTACHSRPGQVIDHDHITGLTRGYLDRECNLVIDRCRHLEGCPFASHAEKPAGSALGVSPEHPRTMRQPRYRMRRLAFELVMAGGVSPGIGTMDVEDMNQWALPAPEGLPDPILHP